MGLCCSKFVAAPTSNSLWSWCDRHREAHRIEKLTENAFGLFAIDSDDEETLVTMHHHMVAGDGCLFDPNLIETYVEEFRELRRCRETISDAGEETRFLIAESIGRKPPKRFSYGLLDGQRRGKKSEADALKQCKVIFVTGGPGSGKGTQCQKILEDFDVGHVSTGDLIRAEVETGSERAKQMKEVMEKGELVSLDIVLELLREHLVKNASQHKGFLVDGFPREIDQATRFEKEVVECLCMLYMDASEEEMKSRILERAKTSGRSDDNEETIAKRIETFKSHNDAIVQHFEEKKKLVKIDCNSTDVDAIYATVREALEKQGLERKGAENANGEANNTAKEGAAAEEAKPEGDANAAETGDGAKEEAKEEEKKE